MATQNNIFTPNRTRLTSDSFFNAFQTSSPWQPDTQHRSSWPMMRATYFPLSSFLASNSCTITNHNNDEHSNDDDVYAWQMMDDCFYRIVQDRTISHIIDIDESNFGISLIHNLMINQIFDDAIFESCPKGRYLNKSSYNKPSLKSFALSFFNDTKIWNIAFKLKGKKELLKLILNSILLLKIDKDTYIQISGPLLSDTTVLNAICDLKKELSKSLTCQPSDRYYNSQFQIFDDILCLFKCKHGSNRSMCIMNECVCFYDNNFHFNSQSDLCNFFVCNDRSLFNKLLKPSHAASKFPVKIMYSKFVQKLSMIYPEFRTQLFAMYFNISKLDLSAIIHSIFHNVGVKKINDGDYNINQFKTVNKKCSNKINQAIYFLRTIITRLFGNYLLGSVNNMKKILNAITLIVRSPQKISMVKLIRHFKISSIPWLKGFHNYHKMRIFAHFLYFIIKDCIHALFSFFFVVGKSTVPTVYPIIYTKRDWTTFIKEGFQNYTKERPNFKRLTKQDLKQQRLVAKVSQKQIHHLKFIQTNNHSIRPICDMKITNRKLKFLLSILHSLFDCDPSLSGYGIVNCSIEKSLNGFLFDHDYSKFNCIGKCDVTKCFDSINRVKLFDILDDIAARFYNYKFVTFRYQLFNFDENRYYYKLKSLLIDGSKYQTDICFKELYLDAKLNKNSSNVSIKKKNPTIIVQSANVYFDSIKSIIKRIKNSLSNIILNNHGRYYELVDGIPQGHLLSTYLCNIYLGYIESKYIMPFVDEHKVGILRFVDDYLILANDQQQLFQTISLLNSTLPMNQKKNETIVPVIDNKAMCPIVQSHSLTWCGIKVQYDQILSKIECMTDMEKNLLSKEPQTIICGQYCKKMMSQRLQLVNILALRLIIRRTSPYLLITIGRESTILRLTIDIAAFVTNFIIKQFNKSNFNIKFYYKVLKLVRFHAMVLYKRFQTYTGLGKNTKMDFVSKNIVMIFTLALGLNIKHKKVLKTRQNLLKRFYDTFIHNNFII